MKELTSSDFKEKVLGSKDTILIDFWAEWCGPCKMMLPILKEVEAATTGVKFYKVNTDKAGDVAGQFRIMSIPCLILLKNGKEVDRMVGFQSAEKVATWIKNCKAKKK